MTAETYIHFYLWSNRRFLEENKTGLRDYIWTLSLHTDGALWGLLWNLVLHADQPALEGSVKDRNCRLWKTSFVLFQYVRLTLYSLRNVASIMACVHVHEEKISITNALMYCHKSKYHYVTQICKKIFTGQVNLAWQRVINMNSEIMW